MSRLRRNPDRYSAIKMLNIGELTRFSIVITHHLMAMNDLKPFITKKQRCHNSVLLVWSTQLYVDSFIKCSTRASLYSAVIKFQYSRLCLRNCWVFIVLAHNSAALPVWVTYYAFKIVLVSHPTISESVNVTGLMPSFSHIFFMGL